MRRQSIGDIDFVWGREGTDARNYEDGYGIAKIEKTHPGAATRIAGFIAYGDVYDDESVVGKYYIVKGRNLVVLQKRKGRNSYLVTEFTGDNPNYVKRIRKENKLIEKGEQ